MDLALNKLQLLMCRKTKLNQTKSPCHADLCCDYFPCMQVYPTSYTKVSVASNQFMCSELF